MKNIWTTIFLMLFTFGCIDEKYTPDETNGQALPDGKVRLELVTDAGAYKLPQSRAGMALEDLEDKEPLVFVFKGIDENVTAADDDDMFVLSDAAKAHWDGTKTTVVLTETTFASRIFVLANMEEFMSASPEEIKDLLEEIEDDYGTSLADFVLISDRLTNPQTEVPYTSPAASPIPMTGALDVSSITTGVTIGIVPLTRIVAKVTVNNTAANFTLLTAGVVNAPDRIDYNQYSTSPASWDLVDYLEDTSNTGIDNIAPAASNTTAANPMYIYPSSKDNQTAVIIKGTYQGATYFYKIGFLDADGAPKDLLRNVHYTIHIQSITGRGYPTLQEAIGAPLSTDITSVVKSTDM